MNWFYRTIDRSIFRDLLQMTRSSLQLIYRIKLTRMILSNYDEICEKIKVDFKISQRVFLTLNEWTNSQKVAFLKVMMYWVDDNFQYREHLVEFASLDISHIDFHLLNELMKILNRFDIKTKLFKVVIDNVNHNYTFKNELKKTMNRRDFQWDKAQCSISCLVHIFNLVTQNFINALDSKFLKTKTITLKNAQVDDVVNSIDIFQVIKKILSKSSNANE